MKSSSSTTKEYLVDDFMRLNQVNYMVKIKTVEHVNKNNLQMA